MVNLTSYTKREWILQNRFLSLCYDEVGGSLLSLTHCSSAINPLNFSFPRPENPEASFEGHFICTPRWGDPSTGEKNNKAVKHGDLSLQTWNVINSHPLQLSMASASEIDQLEFTREVNLSASAPVCTVSETIKNTSGVFRPCNLVQHPTIAAPFLNPETSVQSNGVAVPFENGKKPVETIHSYSLDANETGWITAMDKRSNLLLGYCWKATDYAWIHHWIHEENSQVIYRGMEFGTAALHVNWTDLFAQYSGRFQEKPACFFLDAGESRTFTYHFFLTPIPSGCSQIQEVKLHNGVIEIIHTAGSFLPEQ